MEKNLLRLAVFFSLLCGPFLSYGQIPSGYYNSAAGLNGQALQTALHDIIDGHSVKSYDYLWTAFQTTDVNASDKVWDMYSNCTFTFVTDQCGNYANECDCYNREHSFPASWFNDASPMYTDLFHLVPTDGKVNGLRDNNAFGETSSPTTTTGNGSKVGPCSYPGYTGIIFEPIDEYKGDFARNYFYMATRYADIIAGWENNQSNSDAVLDGTSYPAYEEWFLEMIMEWHTNDPVSTKEINRNNAVYAIQNNRNPYIDHPEYVALVWGDGAPEPTNHATDFSAHNITLNWIDATGTNLPDGYLVRMSTISFAAIETPTDGITVADDFYNQNIAYDIETCIFAGLVPNTIHYFKIFGFTASGTSIAYKTDGTVQQVAVEAK
jgi:endonuclease I